MRRAPVLLILALVAAVQAWSAGPAGAIKLAQVDGGPGYYARFSRPLPAGASYFPVGVWFESVVSKANVDLDRAAGLNLYVVLTANSNVALAQANGMKTVLQADDWRSNTQTQGWFLADEVDMNPGPGAGYSQMQSIAAGVPGDRAIRYSNYGKGVTFWESDAEAARFVNDYQDLVSADNYWFTDDNICSATEGGSLVGGGASLSPAQCHRAANYGATVERVRSLIHPAGSKPVWAIVELGHPASESDWPTITPPQVRAAVWQSLIAGARGIVYFNHSFGGPDQTQHLLRDGADPGSASAPIRAMVTATNHEIEALAPVLNSPTVTAGWSQGPGTTSMVKWVTAKKKCRSKAKGRKCKNAKSGKKRLYVFAGSAGGQVRGRFRIRCVGDTKARVVGENRAVRVRHGTFTDSFADGNAIHIYRIATGSRCGSPHPAAVPPTPPPVGRRPPASAAGAPWAVIVSAAAVAGLLLGGFARLGARRRRMRGPGRGKRAHHLGAR